MTSSTRVSLSSPLSTILTLRMEGWFVFARMLILLTSRSSRSIRAPSVIVMISFSVEAFTRVKLITLGSAGAGGGGGGGGGGGVVTVPEVISAKVAEALPT